jgi:hypothetical protein
VKTLYGRAQQQVFALSFEQLCWAIIIVVAAGLIPLYFIKPTKKASGPIMDVH